MRSLDRGAAARIALHRGLTHCRAMRTAADFERRQRIMRGAGALASVAAAATIGLLILQDRDEIASPGSGAGPPRASTIGNSEDSGPGDLGLVELQLYSGDELEISLSDLPEGEPVLLSLGLPTSPAGSLPVRILAADGRILETNGAVYADDPTRASVEIEADWLGSPGRYIVEIKTKERTHFPLRRYAIEVR